MLSLKDLCMRVIIRQCHESPGIRVRGERIYVYPDYDGDDDYNTQCLESLTCLPNALKSQLQSLCQQMYKEMLVDDIWSCKRCLMTKNELSKFIHARMVDIDRLKQPFVIKGTSACEYLTISDIPKPSNENCKYVYYFRNFH